MKDYLATANRLEGFLKYYYAILKTEEYDPYYYTANYLIDRYELNVEQQLWMSWLYGFIYNGASAWVVLNEFPDFENVDLERLRQWENTHYRYLQFETDTRYKKGKIQQALPAYMNTIGGDQTQEQFFRKVCDSEDPRENFRKLWKVITNFYLFGRYSAFFYLETLYRVNGLPIECDSLFLRDISGSKSHRNGLAYTLGLDHWDMHKSNPHCPAYTLEMYEYLEGEADRILSIMKSEYPDVAPWVDYFSAETAWCAYKGFYRRRRYFGYYLDRDATQICEAEDQRWRGIDWSVFWQCREESLDPRMRCELKGYYGPRRDYMDVFLDEGEMVNLNVVFPEDYSPHYEPPRESVAPRRRTTKEEVLF